MAAETFHWSDEIVEHLAQHDVTPDDFIAAFENALYETESRSSGKASIVGYDDRGRKLFCAFNWLTDIDIEPVTAYEIE